jgi:glycosyltransferase involved in cell wall biosynthesis
MHDRALTAGRLWDSGKNVAVLDRAAAGLHIPFEAAGAIAGPNGERVTLRHLHALGLLDEEALGRRLAARPVFVSAARYEPFGLAVLEAAAAGCALVLSDIPTFRELWNDAAVFVAPDDDAGFADAISELIGDAPRRLALGQAAQSRAAAFTPAAMAAGMLTIYREVARPAAASTRVAA